MTSAVNPKSHSSGWLFYVLPLLLLGLLLAGCGGEHSSAVKLSGGTMGTTWHVTYVPVPEGPSETMVREGVQAALDVLDASMSTYQPDSEISRLNRAPVGEWFAASSGFMAVLDAALDIGRESEGAYDVTVAPLVNLWGFGPGRGEPAVPAAADIAALREQVGQQYLEVDRQNTRVRKQRAVTLDFSSIAKGYAVDEVARYLRGQQIADFLVEVGGEMQLSGQSPRGDAWRIAIEQPTVGMRGVEQALSLSDVAVATSGDYRNFFEMDGRRYSHSIDPRTGYPVAHDLVSVTVVAGNCMAADAWATALTVLGPEDAMRVASAHGLAVYFIRRQGDGFAASHTPAFAQYLETDERVAAHSGERLDQSPDDSQEK